MRFLLLICFGFISGLSYAADAPSLDDLKKPAPNPAWNIFGVRGTDTIELAPGVFTFGNGGERTMFFVTSEGVIATDPMRPAFAAEMRKAIAAVTDLPVKYVIYSHEHWDHILGGQIFKDEGATFLSHANCLDAFLDLPHKDLVMPDEVHEGDYTLELGDSRVELLYFGRNHGRCLWVMRPVIGPDGAGDILFMPDLVTPGGLVGGTMNDYSLHNMVRTLKELEAMDDFSFIVGGHGAAIAHRSAITERRAYLEALMAAVKEAVDAGMPASEIHRTVRVPEFSYMRNYNSFIERNVYRTRVYWGMGW